MPDVFSDNLTSLCNFICFEQFEKVIDYDIASFGGEPVAEQMVAV